MGNIQIAMQDNQIKFAKFEEAITGRATVQRDELLESFEKNRLSELEKLRNDLSLEFDDFTARQFKKISFNSTSEVSKNTVILKQKMFEKRVSLKNKIFEEVLEKLREFTNSDKYLPYLLNKIQQAMRDISSKDSVVFLREEDKKYFPELKAILPFEVEVTFSNRVKIGGAIVENVKAGLINDESIDEKFFNSDKWFYENSDFNVSILQ